MKVDSDLKIDRNVLLCQLESAYETLNTQHNVFMQYIILKWVLNLLVDWDNSNQNQNPFTIDPL